MGDDRHVDHVRGPLHGADRRIDLNPGVLGFTLLVAMVTGLVFGTFPALASRIDLVNSLKSGSKGTSSIGGATRFRAR